jgi:hypothetical protein
MADKDPNEMAAEKLNKEIKKVQEEQRKQFDMPRKNMPTENDMGPLPEKKAKSVKPLGMKKGGKIKCMARGGGCEVRGKTKGRMI